MKKQINRYELKVSLSGNRNIYRILKICGTETLHDLSELILWSLNFDSEHLYYFKTSNDNTYYYSHPDGMEKSANITIDRLHLEPKQKLSYLYDFGDEWRFTIAVRKIELSETYVKSYIVESKGTVEQYPDFDDDEYEDEYDEEIHENSED